MMGFVLEVLKEVIINLFFSIKGMVFFKKVYYKEI